MNKYIVTNGIFEGTIFNGAIIKDRIYNDETSGQSYPLKNCEIHKEKSLKIGDKIKVIKNFPNGNFIGKQGIILEFSHLNKPVLYVEIEGKRLACLPDYIQKY
jgi:hypothetical protein